MCGVLDGAGSQPTSPLLVVVVAIASITIIIVVPVCRKLWWLPVIVVVGVVSCRLSAIVVVRVLLPLVASRLRQRTILLAASHPRRYGSCCHLSSPWVHSNVEVWLCCSDAMNGCGLNESWKIQR